VPGTYAIDLVPADPRAARQRLCFAIDAQPPEPPPADAWITLGPERLALTLTPEARLPVDLSTIAHQGLGAQLPPLWRLDLRWSGADRLALGTLFADPHGELASEELLERVRGVCEAEPCGNLELDAGELGRLVLEHDRAVVADEVASSIGRFLVERRTALELAASEPDLLREALLLPLCASLGFRVGQPQPLGPATLMPLESATREAGRVLRARRAALVQLPPTAGGGLGSPEGALRLGREALDRLGVDRAFCTSGPVWMLVERGRRLAHAPLDLLPSIAGSSPSTILQFVTLFHD
jgi:hypothetical protein